MLFNSYVFIFAFLPLTLAGFHLIGRHGHRKASIAWLVAASLFFYGWWNPAYLGLILASMLFNYGIGVSLGKHPKRGVLVFGVAANLALLGYYKYANFFVENINTISGSHFTLEKIILPLAISFFTFQQVAYLVDAYRGETHEYHFFQYALFVVFFPQLIAGPIVHHKEILPQFEQEGGYRIRGEHLAVGLTIFALGLFKKVVLADGIAAFATPMFHAAETAARINFVEAWGGTLAYTFQIYFDFSGYSDMAIGLARMFGIVLPLNFNSPYKASSIIEFWRRWHITLSRFLRDYLYIPLGGSRKGEPRRMVNLMVTMLLGGMWHGAGWTFILWGGMHGGYLAINHVWRKIKLSKASPEPIGQFISWALTFLVVVIAWVPFRAESIHGAKNIMKGMAGLNGVPLPSSIINTLHIPQSWMLDHGVIVGGTFRYGNVHELLVWLVGLFLVVLSFPNAQQIMHQYNPAIETYKNEIKPLRFAMLQWRPTGIWALFSALIFATALLFMNRVSEFLYFQF